MNGFDSEPDQTSDLKAQAEKYLSEMRLRAESQKQALEGMGEQLRAVSEEYRKLWSGMKSGERRFHQREDGKFFIVRRIGPGLRMAVAEDKDEYIDPWTAPESDEVSEWQDVTVDAYRGQGNRVTTIRHWSSEQLEKLRDNSDRYLGLATTVEVGNLDTQPPDVIVESFNKSAELMQIPDEIFAPK